MARPDKLLDVLTSKAVLPAHLNNIIRALQGRKLSGDKVSRFAANLRGDLSDVTIDVWICKAYGINPKTLTPTLYRRLEKRIQTDARVNDMQPANWQFYGMLQDGRQANVSSRLLAYIVRFSVKRLALQL